MQSKKILFSIVIPHHNNHRVLKRCLQSLCNQSLEKKFFETIIIDDFSKIDINKIFSFFKKKLNKINLIQLHKNKGPGLARNYGIKAARGRYIIFLDCDDCLKKNTLSLLKKIIKKKQYQIISYNYELHHHKRNVFMRNDSKILNVSKSNFIKLFLSMNYNNSVIFSAIKKSFVLKNKIFFEAGIHEDILFFFKMFYFSNSKYYLNKNLYIKYNNDKSIINTFTMKHIDNYIKSWYDVKKFLLQKKDINFFNKYYLRYYAKGLIGVASILIIKNNEFNKKDRKRRYLFYSIIYNKISRYFLKDIKKSNIKYITKYDQIFDLFVNSFRKNKKKDNFYNFEKKMNIIKNEK